MEAQLIIRIATVCSLAGLLLAVGLRLRFEDISESIRRCRFTIIFGLNFGLVPILFAVAVRVADLPPDSRVALILLGAAPFAPVVPVFARMARADLALAAGLTSIYPVLSAFLTPLLCAVMLKQTSGVHGLSFATVQVLLVLVATTTVPLVLGVTLNHLTPQISRRCLRPVEVASEAAGAFSLGFVVFVEFSSIVHMSAMACLITAVLFEVCLLAGYCLGAEKGSRRVLALGTSNRNIALALLVAVQSFSDLHVVSKVAGHGLLLILLGLLHVGYWRWCDYRACRASP